MISGDKVRSILKQASIKQASNYENPISKELHALYAIRSKIEDAISKMIVENINKHPDILGITFYDSELGQEYQDYKASLKRLPIEIVADHICNWCVLNEYYSKFQYYPSTNTIQFLIKWYDENLYPRS